MTNIEKLIEMPEEERIDFLHDVVAEWAGCDSDDGSYIYDLDRVKSGFNYGTVTINDYIEWDMFRTNEVAFELCKWLFGAYNEKA